jgi:hypothetical protein
MKRDRSWLCLNHWRLQMAAHATTRELRCSPLARFVTSQSTRLQDDRISSRLHFLHSQLLVTTFQAHFETYQPSINEKPSVLRPESRINTCTLTRAKSISHTRPRPPSGSLPCTTCSVTGPTPTPSPSFLLAQAIFEPNLLPYGYSNILKFSHSTPTCL